MAQEHKAKQEHKAEVAETTSEAPTESISSIDEEEFDDFLAELDEVLEENAQEFIHNYIQQGGQ